MGLNDSFSNIKAQLILHKPTPSLSEVYAFVQQEEKRKQISHLPNLHDTLALATNTHYSPTRDTSKYFSSQRRDRLFCTFCKVLGHSLEKCFKANPHLEKPTCTHCHLVGHTAKRCYKLHGYPPGHKVANHSKGPSPSVNQLSENSQAVLTKEQYQHHIALLCSSHRLHNQLQTRFSPLIHLQSTLRLPLSLL